MQSQEIVQYPRNTSHANKLLQNSDTLSAQEKPTQWQSAVEVPNNAVEPTVPNALEPTVPNALSAFQRRVPIVPEPEGPVRRSKTPSATPS